MAHIIIAGGGIGGIPASIEVRRLLSKKEHEVTVISDKNYFHFVPSNPWVGVNWRNREDISVDLAPMFKKRKINFIHDEITRFVPEDNIIQLKNGDDVSYDYLIIATGPKLDFDAIEGFGPKSDGGHTQSICHIDHAEPAGDAWAKFLEDPGPIIVGAAQGASCFGPAYEFAFTMETDLRKKKIRHKVPITFVTSEPYIGHLGLEGVGDTKSMLESALRHRNVKWITNAKMDKVEDGMMHVSEMATKDKVKESHELPFKYAMMLPAFKGIDALFTEDGMPIEGLSNPKGFVLTDEFQRNPTYNNIYAIGVCIAIPPLGESPVPVGVPKTGYMIESMVTATAHNIKDEILGKETSHKGTLNALCLADFGDGGMAFIAKPQIPPRNVNKSYTGRWVHWAKIGFEKYFLYKVKKGVSEPFLEKYSLRLMGIKRLADKVAGKKDD